MKVKNIVFSGFAAAILMGIAADASAEVQVATKAYIDSLDNVLLAPEGSVVSGVTQENGKVMSLTLTEFDTVIPEENPSNTTAPTTAAVYNYVTSAVDGMEYSGDDYITVDNDNNEIELTNITNEAAGITGTSTALTTGKAVYEYVAANDDDTTYTAGEHITIGANNAIAVNDVTSAGTDIVSGDTGLTTGNAVYEYVTTTVEGMEYSSGDDYITVDNDNNEIELTNYTDDSTEITNGNTALTTANAVYDYVTQLTGGVLPDGCNEEGRKCSLVKLNGTLQWVDLTEPTE